MRLRRRILKYFLLLIVLMSLVNLAVSYYLAETSWGRFQGVVRTAFLQQTADNLLEFYAEKQSFFGAKEAAVWPREFSVWLPRRSAWGNDHQFVMALPVNSVWNIVAADRDGRFFIGSEKSDWREEPGVELVAGGQTIGMVWLVRNPNSSLTLLRNYLIVPFLFRNFLTMLISFAFALGIAFLFSDNLAKHIGELAAAARHIAEGKLDYRVKTGAQDELGELAKDFNLMAEKLQQDQQLRRQMQADVVHELRTPLAVCQAVLDSLDNGVVPWNEKTLVSLQEETSRMNRLVTDLHELNRADNQKLQLYKELIMVGDLLERLQDSFGEMARRKTIWFDIQTDHELRELILYVDVDRIMQAILNILHNALRHTQAGGTITVAVSMEFEAKVALAVKDTGEGIPAEILPHVFDRFFSGDMSRSRQRSGTGLGLAIAREYVRLHGGDIVVVSEPLKGSRFTVYLPVEEGMQTL